MKEDKEKALVICKISVNFLHSDENPASEKEEKIEIKEPILTSYEEVNGLSEPGIIMDDNSGKELADENRVKLAESHLLETESNSFLTNNVDKSKLEDSESLFQTKLILRPRKTEINQNLEEDSKIKKSKSGCRKIEKKCAIKKDDNLECNESSSVCYTDSSLKLKNDFSIVTTEQSDVLLDSEIESSDVKLDVVENVQNLVNYSANEEVVAENLPVVKLPPDEDSSKSKDNCESDTRISSASENSILKATKKRRRRREVWWTKSKRKKKPDGQQQSKSNASNQSGTLGFQWREVRNISSTNENFINGKRKGSEGHENVQKKPREFAIPSPSLADISMKAAIPESTATSVEASKPKLCLCRKKPNVFISGNNNAGDLYCQALDCIDSRIVGCCNTIPSQDVGLYRASEKASYQMMCNVHQQRLLRHHCCPGCGLFCTQGKYLMCKSWHHFHRACFSDNKNDGTICPHCGDSTPAKLVVVSILSSKDPVFLPHQKPIRNLKSAKMTIARGNVQMIEEDENPTFNFPASIFKLDGDEVSPANGMTQILQRDKLENLLNIACRSFSKMCCSNRYSFKSLYITAQSGDVEKLLKIIASGLNPNYVFEEHNNQTALHVAAGNGHLAAVHILLQAKAQINVFDGEQNTPLTAAINAKHNEVVKYLIKCGADLILKGEDGMTPLHIAAKCGNVGACFHLLNGTHLPARYIDSLDDGGWTPMVWASEFNHIEVVRFLISKGADPLVKDAEQNIALHWAAFGGSIDIVEMFLNDGSDINSVNVHGDTPLHIAARQHKYSCVLLLLARGARSDIKNKNGEQPRDCSESPSSDIYKGITLNMEISALLTRFQDRSPKIVCNDISRGKERNQIQCVNGVDDEGEPENFVYVNESCFTSKITVDRTITSLQSCKCGDVCSSDNCNCALVSVKCWYDNDGKLKPDFNYLDPPLIFECNQACRCNKITCRNRVVQSGLTCRFQLFKTEGRGWGIKTLNLIQKGTFVCEYVGEIISDWEADHREDDSYLFDLENRDGETYCIDARYYGNFARFINHMCVPNLMPVHIFVDHQDLRFPRIAFFANRDILPNEELGYNYGDKFWVIKWKSFTCVCGSEKCLYSENTIQTTLDNYQKKLSEENP